MLIHRLPLYFLLTIISSKLCVANKLLQVAFLKQFGTKVSDPLIFRNQPCIQIVHYIRIKRLILHDVLMKRVWELHLTIYECHFRLQCTKFCRTELLIFFCHASYAAMFHEFQRKLFTFFWTEIFLFFQPCLIDAVIKSSAFLQNIAKLVAAETRSLQIVKIRSRFI